MIELIGYVATGFNVAGNLLLTRMNVWGWVVRLLVNVLYIAYAVQIDHGGPVIINHALFLLINIEGWRRWRKLPRAFSCKHQWAEMGGYGGRCVKCGAVWKEKA